MVKKKRPVGLVAIVCYKAFMAALLAAISVALLLTFKHHEALQAYFASSALESGKAVIIDWLLKKVLSIRPRTIEFSGIAAGLYATVSTVEAIGLWYEKTWAELLVIGLTGLSIPLEVFELIHHASLLKGIVLLLNITVFYYLFHQFLRSKDKKVPIEE